MNATPKNRAVWVGGLIVTALYFAPQIIGTIRQALFFRPPVAARQNFGGPHRPQAPPRGPGRPPAVPPPLAGGQAPPGAGNIPGVAIPAGAPAAAPNALRKLLGKWQGSAPLQPNGGICNLQLEVRENQEKGGYAGYSMMTCPLSMADVMMPVRNRASQAAAMRAIRKAQTPMSAILAGTADDDSIQFRVDKNLGSDCAMTVLPFGTDQIAAEFKGDPSCQGAHMVLRRIGK